ncbi:transient receptor potential cation channel subfamily A member 1 [Thrips palmi]|uniref:Transient receptor potential cation channel subfamily A member 1 n=1 Tax=Thrips palmi TaxID=161013 RepID=A0A6P9AB21_THRPL|nr:transient receptor potential cation channel subfamily A member 1 [Thrips palmi]
MPEPPDGKGELQTMLHHHSSPSLNGATVVNTATAAYTAVTIPPEAPAVPAVPGAPVHGEICLLTESPFRILRAAESGNVEDFARLLLADPRRLTVRDSRGRVAVHQAAARNRINILQFIVAHEGDLNVQDKVGNTPLHVAVEASALEALDFLLSSNVDTSILNEKHQAPIHLATELNNVKALEVMGRHKDKVDAMQGGEHGRTALHIAAIYDHDQCAKVLISNFSACRRKACANGFYPIHEAAKNASSRTMEVILQWGETNCMYTREQMMSLYDAEGNVPLHSAVHGGDIKAVELCLRSGARISTQQHDLSTPVHLACAQGAGDIVRLMFSMQPGEKAQCLASCDAQKMTPLHCAAMFDHPDIVEFLAVEGADVNAKDKESRSPLLLAASRGGWRTVISLIRLGANIRVKDNNTRNVLHLVVMNGGRLDELASTVINAQAQKDLHELLNEKDSAGCSPLHYASREGHIRSLENLIRLGACINLKNHNNESPLHFAARFGRYNTVRQLLDSEKGSFIINESDGEGLTPLHIASQQGHTRVVQLLLNRGALLHRDHMGRNPLHLAAMSGYTQTMELLQSVHSHLLDQVDKDGNTALHLATMENKPNSISLLLSMNCKLLYNYRELSAIDYAIYYKYPEAALAMVTHDERAQEVLELKSDKHPCVTLALIAAMPRVFESVQDKCITKANCKKDSKSFYIKYNFDCLRCPPMPPPEGGHPADNLLNSQQPSPLPALNIKYNFFPYTMSQSKLAKYRKELANPSWYPPPLKTINAMVVHGRVELLAHPLSQKYLQMKWHSYGKYFHLANLLLYSIFLVFVTGFSTELMQFMHEHDRLNNNLTQEGDATTPSDVAPDEESPWTHGSHRRFGHRESRLSAQEPRPRPWHLEEKEQRFVGTPLMYACSVVIVTYVAIHTVREMLQLYQQRGAYLLDPSNLVPWVLYLAAAYTVLPMFAGVLSEQQVSCASIMVFLAWFNLLLFLQRFDRVGIYVVMFLEILQTLIKVLLIFSILIIAFGLAFYILLSRGNHLSFGTVPMSLLRIFSMMLGEIDFLGSYVQPFFLVHDAEPRWLPMPLTTFLVLAVFMVIMPILLMNLLIGLAVGDIESVRRNAQLKRLAMQVVLHTELERKLPRFMLEKVDKMELIEYPNNECSRIGFVDTLLRKWFCSPFNDDDLDSTIPDLSEDVLSEELMKTKQKLKEITTALETQHMLLRLVVQKMEIKTEADDVDEGVSSKELKPASGSSKWTSPRVRKKLRAVGRSYSKSASM